MTGTEEAAEEVTRRGQLLRAPQQQNQWEALMVSEEQQGAVHASSCD